MSDEASRFIRSNYDKHDRLAIAVIRRGSSNAIHQDFVSAEVAASPDYLRRLHNLNEARFDIYASTNAMNSDATSRTKTDVATIRHLYVDLDSGRENLDRILKEPNLPRPHHVLESSPNKYQLLWQVKGYSNEEAERAVKGLVYRFDGDRAAVDCNRVLRVPGFVNQKYPELNHVVRDVQTNPPQVREYTPRDFPTYPIERPEWSQARIYKAMTQQPEHGQSQSEKDWNFVMRHLERGDNPAVVEHRVAQWRSEDRPGAPAKYNPEQYARYTVAKAQAMLASRPMPMAQHSRESRGMER